MNSEKGYSAPMGQESKKRSKSEEAVLREVNSWEDSEPLRQRGKYGRWG